MTAYRYLISALAFVEQALDVRGPLAQSRPYFLLDRTVGDGEVQPGTSNQGAEAAALHAALFLVSELGDAVAPRALELIRPMLAQPDQRLTALVHLATLDVLIGLSGGWSMEKARYLKRATINLKECLDLPDAQSYMGAREYYAIMLILRCAPQQSAYYNLARKLACFLIEASDLAPAARAQAHLICDS